MTMTTLSLAEASEPERPIRSSKAGVSCKITKSFSNLEEIDGHEDRYDSIAGLCGAGRSCSVLSPRPGALRPFHWPTPRRRRSERQQPIVHDATRKAIVHSVASEGTDKELLLARAEPGTARAVAQPSSSGKKPNIVVIMGDDVGVWNIGAYHRGMMAGRTPNLDRLASQGMLFTDYYAEASCTAGRANFITGQLPIRTGMTTVGQAGATIGLPAQAPTIATALKSMGYATGQFGKNHLGDLNEFLPTVHGFDEFFGYLYHLDAMEDPAHPNYPPELKDKVGPRNMVH